MTKDEKKDELKAQITQAHIDGYNRGYAKAKAELEQTNNKLLDVINGQDVKIADLEKQIEKMKCCENCRWLWLKKSNETVTACSSCKDKNMWRLKK